MTAFALVAALLLLALLAPVYGADSRDGRDWQPRLHHDRHPLRPSP